MKKVFIMAAAAVVTVAAIAFRPAHDSKVTMIITHEVKDYAAWRKSFDSDETNRAKAGVHITGVYASVDNPNMITVTAEAPNADVAKGMTSSPELKASMEKAGVISKPEIKILNHKH